MKSVPLALAATIIFSGCAPYVAPIAYKEPVGNLIAINSKQGVSIGKFSDLRSQSSGHGETWFGVIRNGWGIPIKHLYTEIPVSEIVRNSFNEALRARKVIPVENSGKVQILGQILAFECDAIVGYGATTTIRIDVIETSTRANLYSNVYSVLTLVEN